MAPNRLQINPVTLMAALGAIVIIEILLGWGLHATELPRFAKLGAIRLAQTGAMLWVVMRLEGSLGAIGWAPSTWLAGAIKGAFWSLAFAGAAALGMALIYMMGQNPMPLIRSPLPSRMSDLILFFLVGGLLAPIAEEICFRGILYTYFRRWGIGAALAASTAIFVLLHLNRIPATQIVGGLVFAVTYENSRNLMVPITIHALGNLALFTLSLPVVQAYFKFQI